MKKSVVCIENPSGYYFGFGRKISCSCVKLELCVRRGKTNVGVIIKDVVMLGGIPTSSSSAFTADNPGDTLLHCHQQLHMDFGFMALFKYA